MSRLIKNQFHLLREHRLAEATREFLARGKSVRRCELCQLAEFACLCPWRPELSIDCEFVLLMHRNEVFKPTNTGRLIADVFPQQTQVFCWNRTTPEARLLDLLTDERRQCVLVFPPEAAEGARVKRELWRELPVDRRGLTFILLDGTWKQSGRMYHLSRWLEATPTIALPESLVKSYVVRKSHQEHYLSTAEAASLCLELFGDLPAAEVLQDYFQLFNQHYLATRACTAPEIGELHARLSNCQGVSQGGKRGLL